MPTLMPNDTRAALGPSAERCDSRSLLLDRFTDPGAKENERKTVFTRMFGKEADGKKASVWSVFLAHGLGLQRCAVGPGPRRRAREVTERACAGRSGSRPHRPHRRD